MDHAELFMPSEIRRGKEDEPYGVLTQLGWVVRGKTSETKETRTLQVHFLAVEETPLQVQFKRFWETEKYGTEGEENRRTLLSEEDQKAVAIVQEETRKLNPGYEVPIPWRTKEQQLKNNKTVALRR